ncbi:MAG: hypothetical protein OXE86_18700 [Alphaproteobacteria bacterium]|nr:hypothetical protein [Alphaproteobacteria bacterium]
MTAIAGMTIILFGVFVGDVITVITGGLLFVIGGAMLVLERRGQLLAHAIAAKAVDQDIAGAASVPAAIDPIRDMAVGR